MIEMESKYKSCLCFPEILAFLSQDSVIKPHDIICLHLVTTHFSLIRGVQSRIDLLP